MNKTILITSFIFQLFLLTNSVPVTCGQYGCDPSKCLKLCSVNNYGGIKSEFCERFKFPNRMECICNDGTDLS